MNPPPGGAKGQHGASTQPTVSLRRFDVTDQRLLDTIDGADPLCSPEIMAQLLNRHKSKIFKGLGWFGAPNAKSAAVIKSGQAPWRGKSFTLDKTQQDFVTQLSSAMQLDEVQAFEQFQNYLRTEVKGQTFEYELSTIEQILNFYLEERLAILKCAARLLRGMMDVNFVYRSEAKTAVMQLLNDKWAEEVMSQYTMLTKQTVPARLERSFAERWATQYVLEQAAILEVILLLYYDALPRGFPVFLKFCELFSAHAFGARQINYSALTELGRASTKRIKYLCILILLETLDLESYAGGSFSMQTDFLSVDKVMATWGSLDAHGPILLAWSAILCRVEQVVAASGSAVNPLEGLISYSQYGRLGTQLQGADMVLKLLREEAEEARVGYTLAHKSILSGWLVALCSAFFADDLPFYGSLIQLHAEIHRDEPALGDHFWKQYAEGSPLRTLLDLTRERFPYEIEPLVSILTTLAADATCATTVYFFLSDLSTYMQTLPEHARRFTQPIKASDLRASPQIPLPFALDDNTVYITTTHPIEIDLITLPIGAVGRVVGFDKSNEPALVQWAHPHSAWHLFMSFIDNFMEQFRTYVPTILDADIATLTSIIELFAELFSKQPLMATSVQDHLIETVSHLYGINSDESDLAILPRLVQILHTCAYLPRPPLALLTAALKCIKGIAVTQPEIVWQYFRRGLIETADQTTMVIPGPIRHLLDIECAVGTYPVTIAWLDLAESLIGYLQRWSTDSITSPNAFSAPDSKLDTSDFMPCLIYIQTALFLQYESWRYTSIQDKSQLGLKILRIFERLLDDVPQKAPAASAKAQPYNFGDTSNPEATRRGDSGMDLDITDASNSSKMTLQEYLFNSLLYDVSFHTNILNIISMGITALEFNQRRVKNGGAFVELVKSAFTVIEMVLLLKQRASSPTEFDSIGARGSGAVFGDSTQTSADGSSGASKGPITADQQQQAFYGNEMTPLESSILQRKVGKAGLDLIYIIASYISYNYDSVIPTKATQVLTILCGLSKASTAMEANLKAAGESIKGSTTSSTRGAARGGSGFGASSASGTSSANLGSAAPISLVSYFGSMADTLRSEFLWRLSDNREPSALRIAIWRLITEALSSQPGLAELFINIQADPVESLSTPDTSAAAGPTGAAAAKAKTAQDNASASGVPTSCVSVVLGMFTDDEHREWYLRHDPRLLAEALQFLTALWHVASDHLAIFSQIRGQTHFWYKLMTCLSVSADPSPTMQAVLASPLATAISHLDMTKPANAMDTSFASTATMPFGRHNMSPGGAPIGSNPSQHQHHKQQAQHLADATSPVNANCYRVLVDAHVFKILALEVFFVHHNGELDSGLVSELRKLLNEPKRVLALLDDFSDCFFAPDARELLIKTLHWLRIDMAALTQFPTHRIFGTHYLFNSQLLRKKLGLSMDPTQPGNTITSFDHFTNEHIDVMDRISTANAELSWVDAKIQALHSFQNFLQMILLRQSRLCLPEPNTLLLLAKLLATKIGEERRESLATYNNTKEMSQLLLLFARQWTRQVAAMTASQKAARKTADKPNLAALNSLPSKPASMLGVSTLGFMPPQPSASSSASSASKPNPSTPVTDLEADVIYEVLVSLHDALFWLCSKQLSSSICQTLLSTLHMILNSFPVWDDKIQTIAIPIARTCIELLERKDLFKIALSLLDVIAAHSEHSTALLRCFSERNTLGVLVADLGMALVTQTEAEMAEGILFFFLSLANSSADMSEALSSHGLMRCITAESWVVYVRDHMTAYTPGGERNPWHRAWNLSLALVTRLLRMLGHWEDCVSLTLDFVSIHSERIFRALDTHTTRYQAMDPSSKDKASSGKSGSGSASSTSQSSRFPFSPYATAKQAPPVVSQAAPTVSSLTFGSFSWNSTASAKKASSTKKDAFGTTSNQSSAQNTVSTSMSSWESPSAITLAALEETERVTSLIFQLGHYRNQWRLALETLTGNLADRLEHTVLYLFQQVSLLVIHPPNIVPMSKAISPQERKALVTQKPASAASKSTAAKSTASTTATSATAATTSTAPAASTTTAAAGPKKVTFSAIPAIKVTGSASATTIPGKDKDAPVDAKGEEKKGDATEGGEKSASKDDAAADADADKKPETPPVGDAGAAATPSTTTTSATTTGPKPTTVIPGVTKIPGAAPSAAAPGGVRSLAQSQMIGKPPEVTKTPQQLVPISGPLAKDPIVPFHERIELSLFRILRNTISLVRLFTPPVFEEGEDGGGLDPETMKPIFAPSGEAALAPVPALGLLSQLVYNSLKKFTNAGPTSSGEGEGTSAAASASKPGASATNPTGAATTAATAAAANQGAAVSGPLALPPHKQEELALGLYAVESAVLILVSHIHLYLAPQNRDEFIRRRVRDEIGQDLTQSISQLMKDWNRISLAPIPAFLQRAQLYLQSLQRR